MTKIEEKNQKWWIFAAMTSVVSMIFIDVSVLPVALPTIQRSLGLSDLGLYWILNGYTLALAVFILAGGRMGDRYGHRWVFLYGLFFFTLGSILCGLSQGEAWFISSRILQGLGGALLIPTSAATLFNAFPAPQRGKAMGLYISVGTVFLSVGPFIGGIFTQYFTWRLIFWINIPIAILGFILTLLVVPKSKGNRSHPFDFIGFFAASLAISALTVAIMQVKKWGWFSPWTIGLIILALFLFILLFAVDRTAEDPYIDFSLFKNRNFLGAIAAIFCTQFVLMVTIFWSIYFQTVFHFSPSQAGTLSLISNAPLILAAPLGGHLLDRHGPRVPILIGFFLVTGSLFWFLLNLQERSVPILLSALIPFGCGIPMILTPSFATALGEIPPERRGLASGTSSMIRQIGSTLGLALFGTLFLEVNLSQFGQILRTNVQTQTLDPTRFQGLLSQTPTAVQALQPFSSKTQAFISKSFLHSYINGFWAINMLAAVIALVGGILAFILIKKRTKPEIEI